MVDVQAAQFDWNGYFAEYYKHDKARKGAAFKALLMRGASPDCLVNFLERDIEILEALIDVMSSSEYMNVSPVSGSEITLLRVLQTFILEKYPAYLQSITNHNQKALILEAMVNFSSLKESWEGIFGFLEGKFPTNAVLPTTTLPERIALIQEFLPEEFKESTFSKRFRSFYLEYRSMCEKA